MKTYVYALKNNINNEIYVGIALDPQIRLLEHNRGKNRYTKAFMPWQIFYTEECKNKISDDNGGEEVRKKDGALVNFFPFSFQLT